MLNLSSWFKFDSETQVTAPADPENPGFVSKMINKIADNVRVQVSNVHIRYEDDVSFVIGSDRRPMSIGVALDSLSIFPCDKEGVLSPVVDYTLVSRRMVDVKNLAVYFNTKQDNSNLVAGKDRLLELVRYRRCTSAI